MTTNQESMLNYFISMLQYYGLPAILSYVIYSYISRKSNIKLKGKVVFITGASSGVGEALAHCFYSQGCKVILAARRQTELERVKKDLISTKKVQDTQFEPLVLQLDLAEVGNINNVVQKAFDLVGNIDILINNGGISSRGSVLETDVEVHKKLMLVNHFGPLTLTKAILPRMIKQQSGHILFVSSVQGRMAIPERSAYASSKHACQAFADSLRAEVSKHNINVSVISPGYIQTALSLNALTGTGTQYGVMDASTAAGYKPEYVADQILNMVISQRNELILASLQPRIAVLLRYLFPSLYFWIMSKRAQKSN